MTFCMCLVQSLYKAVPSTRIIVSPPVMSKFLHWQYISLLSERENLCAWEFFSVCFFSILLQCTGCALNYYSIYHYCQSETISVRESFFLSFSFFPVCFFSVLLQCTGCALNCFSIYHCCQSETVCVRDWAGQCQHLSPTVCFGGVVELSSWLWLVVAVWQRNKWKGSIPCLLMYFTGITWGRVMKVYIISSHRVHRPLTS